MDLRSGAPCAIQYPTLFTDSGQIYLSYWTLSDAGTFFHIARLRPVYSYASGSVFPGAGAARQH
jgi:hypothetical protein